MFGFLYSLHYASLTVWVLREDTGLPSSLSLHSDSLNSLFEKLWDTTSAHIDTTSTHTYTLADTCQGGNVCVLKTRSWSDSVSLPPPLFAEPHGSCLISLQTVFVSVTWQKAERKHVSLYSLFRLFFLCSVTLSFSSLACCLFEVLRSQRSQGSLPQHPECVFSA